jgi:enediyne biosynthesis protein E4
VLARPAGFGNASRPADHPRALPIGLGRGGSVMIHLPMTMRSRFRARAVVLASILAACAGCRKKQAPKPPPPEAAAVALPANHFRDVTASAGIHFVQVNGARGQKWMPETMGGGVAVIDYDNDGRPDLLFVSSRYWPGDPREAKLKSSLALYHNDGVGADGLPHFHETTREAGLEKILYGMGATAGDYDNDGWEDLYVTALGGNHLFHNDHGRFVEVTRKARVGDSGWGTSAAFFDYDGDGLLDLFVCRYVDWTPETDLFCTLDGTTKSYCTPERYPGTTSHLYHNNGDGTFTDVTKKAGVENPKGKALAVAAFDFNNDGKIDFAVSNDTSPNNLFKNNGDGTFTDVALEAGVGVDEAGRARGAMGLDWASVRNTAGTRGVALAFGNFANELKSLYWTDSGDVFLDQSPASGLGPSSLLDLTFGLFFFDYDLDGRPDLFLANGHVEPTIQAVQKAVSYRQVPALYWNAGDSHFRRASNEAGFTEPLVARGAAYADLDGDGDLDVIVVENGGPAHVFLNDAALRGRSVRVLLEGSGRSNRDAVGARAEASIGDRKIDAHVRGGGSYASCSERVLTFGLAGAPKVDALAITWPDGTKETYADLAPGKVIHIVEGKGIQSRSAAMASAGSRTAGAGAGEPMGNSPPAGESSRRDEP